MSFPTRTGHGSRELLLMTAQKAFASAGFRAASSRDICAAAGLNPGAIHYHFGSTVALERSVVAGLISRRVELTIAQIRMLQVFDDPALDLARTLEGWLAPWHSFDSRWPPSLFHRLWLQAQTRALTEGGSFLGTVQLSQVEHDFTAFMRVRFGGSMANHLAALRYAQAAYLDGCIRLGLGDDLTARDFEHVARAVADDLKSLQPMDSRPASCVAST